MIFVYACQDKIGRPSDFVTTQVNPKIQRNRRDDNNVNTEFAYRHDAIEDSTFQLVDNTSKTSKRMKSVMLLLQSYFTSFV